MEQHDEENVKLPHKQADEFMYILHCSIYSMLEELKTHNAEPSTSFTT